MDERGMINKVETELLQAEHLLCTEYSFELAEPNYVRCLEILRSAPEVQRRFEELLIAMFKAKKISEEPLAYLMHQLRWAGVRKWLEDELRSMPNPIATGDPFEKVLAAYDDNWENREFYKSL